jgi:hypothetical protein
MTRFGYGRRDISPQKARRSEPMYENHGSATVTESFDVHCTWTHRHAKDVSLHNLLSPLAFEAQ